MDSSPKVIVIGAGLAGLAAAALLKKAGIEVMVIEEGQAVGGRMAGLGMDGFSLDAGLHCFHYAESGPLRELAAALEIPAEFLECNEPSYILRGKDRLPIPPGAASDMGEVPGFTEKEAERMRGFFQLVMEAEPGKWDKKSLADFLAAGGFIEDELINGYAAALGLTLFGAAPAQVSAGLVISHARAAGYPGFHVSALRGGGGAMIEALAGKLSEFGARVSLGSKVHEMEVVEGRVTRVAASDEEFTPAAVIYTGPPRALVPLWKGDKPPVEVARTVKRMVPVSAVSIEFGLDASVFDGKGVLIDPAEAVIGRFPSNLDPSLAPEGAQIASWLALVPHEELTDVKLTRGHLKRLKKIVSSQFPEVGTRVKWERIRVIPNLTGAAPLPSLTPDKKFKPGFKYVDNLFLAGEGLASRGVLSGAAAGSAMEAASLVQEFLAAHSAAAEPTPGKEQ